jgi:DNA-binding SARP family transcriptional activator
VPLDSITDTLWPDADGDMASSAFSSALNRLRKLIGVKDAIRLTDGKVSFNPRYIWVDVHVFETAIRRGRSLRGGAKGREDLVWFESAIDAYRGHFLNDESGSSWIITARERLKNMFLDVLKEVGRYREATKEYDRAIACYQKGLSTDPLEEYFYQRLMTCYFHQGCYAEAARVYERCRTVLKTHFDVPPARTTEDLYRHIRDGDQVRA